jgi:hypothetical protein
MFNIFSQFLLLAAYHLAIDLIAYITTLVLSQNDAFVFKLTNLLNYTNQANNNHCFLQTLYQDLVLKLNSLRLINSDLQA